MEHTPKLDYDALLTNIVAANSPQELIRAVVDVPFAYKVDMARLHLGIIVLLLNNETTRRIEGIAISDTELARGAANIAVKKFEDISIPADDPANYIAKAINTKRPQATTDWHYLFTPAISAEEARFNQAGGGIACSVVYPLNNMVRGALIYSYYQYPEKLGSRQRQFMKNYTTIVSRRLAAGL